MANPIVKIILTADSSGVRGPLETAGKQLADFGKSADRIGQNLEKVGTRIGGIGLAGQAGLSRLGLDMGTLVSGAVEAEKALYGIANTAGVSGEKARAAVGEWTIAINQIAQATNQSQAAVTQAFSDMIAKGLDPKAAVQMLKPIGQAATAAGAEIGDMAAAAQASFDKLKIPVDQVGKSLDIMAQAGKAGAFELRDMAGYFDKISASAANLGMSGQSSLAGLTAAAQIARRGTGDAAQAATNLDNFLGKLNAKVTYKAFDEMGVDLGKLKEEAKASGDYLGYMAEAIQKITNGDTAKVAGLFSDIQAGAFIQGMLRDLDDYKKIREEALNASGVAAQDFATAMQSSAAQIDQFKISASAAVNNGEAMKTILSTMTSIAQWANDNPELAKWLIFGTAGLAVGGAAIAGLGAMVTAIAGISTALGGLATFLAANPIVLTILGIAAAGAAGYALGNYLGLDEIGKKLGSWTYDVVQTLGKLPEELAAMWDRWKEAGAGLVASLKAGIADGLKGALGIGQKLTEALSYLKGEGAKWMQVGRDVMQGLLDGIQAKYREIIAKLKGLGKDMLDSIKDVLGIKSPSKEFMLIGEYAGEGLKYGILAKVKDVSAAAKQLGQAALYATKDQMQAAWLKSTLNDEAGLANAIAADQARLLADGERLHRSLRTELELSMDEFERYEELLRAGAIDWDTYGRAIEQTTSAIKTGMADAAKAVDTVSNKVKASYRDNKGKFLPEDEAARTAAEWQRAGDDIEKSLTDALMRGFEGGKDWLKNFADTLKNTIGSMVLRPIIQPIAQAGSGLLMSVIGMGSASAGGMDLVSGLSAANTLSSYGSAASGYLSTLSGSTYGSGMLSQQSLMLAQQDAGVSALGGSGMAYGGAAAGALYGYQKGGVAGGVAGGLAGYGLGGVASSVLAGGTASAGLSATLGAIPGWGWVALAALAILGGGKKATPHIGLSKEFDATGGADFVSKGDTTLPKWLFGSEGDPSDLGNKKYDGYRTGIDTLGKGLLDSINTGLDSLGGTLKDSFKFTLGFAADNDDKSGGLGRVSVDGKQELEIFKRYASSAKKGFEQMTADILPRITLIAYQTSTGLAPALDTLLDTLDAATASTEEINQLFELATAWQQTAGYAMAEPVKQALEQIEQAGRTSLQVWQDGQTALRTLLGTFDGTLASAQSLGAATQAQYQMELSLIGQIQGLLTSTGAMFGSSIRDIRMSVMDDPAKYDFLRVELDTLYTQLQTAFDPTLIGNLAQQINQLSNQAYGLLDESERAGASTEFIGYLDDVNALTADRLNAAQDQIVQNHQAMAEVIEAAMMRVADQMMAAAEVQRQAAAVQQAAAEREQTIRLEWDALSREVGQG